jgi:hypothetical protein
VVVNVRKCVSVRVFPTIEDECVCVRFILFLRETFRGFRVSTTIESPGSSEAFVCNYYLCVCLLA